MTKPRYSTVGDEGESPERAHRRLVESIDARAERHERLAQGINIAYSMRGRRRPELDISGGPFEPIDPKLIVGLGKALGRRPGKILKDQFTENIPTTRFRGAYKSYREVPASRSQRPIANAEDALQASLARERAPINIRDRVHADIWTEWQLSQLFVAGLQHTRDSVARRLMPRSDGLLIAASAIEDFGFCLEAESHRLTPREEGLPHAMQLIGQYGAQHPESLIEQDGRLHLLVLREAERRAQYWGTLLDRFEQPEWGGGARTTMQLEDEMVNAELIAQLQVQ